MVWRQGERCNVVTQEHGVGALDVRGTMVQWVVQDQSLTPPRDLCPLGAGLLMCWGNCHGPC